MAVKGSKWNYNVSIYFPGCSRNTLNGKMCVLLRLIQEFFLTELALDLSDCSRAKANENLTGVFCLIGESFH